MIRDFADRGTADVLHGRNSKEARRSLPVALWRAGRRKLDRLNAAADLGDLRDPPGNRLEPLAGGLAGFHSIRINDRFRIVFRFASGDASAVQLVDYH